MRDNMVVCAAARQGLGRWTVPAVIDRMPRVDRSKAGSLDPVAGSIDLRLGSIDQVLGSIDP
jgi:hypothetical protein